MKTAAAFVVIALGATAHAGDDPETAKVVITEKGSPFWAGVAVSSGVVTLGVLSAGIYYQSDWREDIASVRVSKPESGPVTQDDCGRAGIEDTNGVFTRMCEKRDRAKTLLLAGMLAVPLVAFTTYLGFVRESRREVRTIALVPTVTPQTAGLTIDVRW